MLQRIPLASFLLIGALVCPAVVAPAQESDEAFRKAEDALAAKASRLLMSFASFAKRNKVGPRAKEAYDTILEHYDADHAGARRALGYRKKKGEWEEPDRRKTRARWLDDANDKQRFAVLQQWRKTALELAKLHRERGLKLVADPSGKRVPAGMAHLRRAIFYDPFDREAHLALGHQEVKVGDKTYYGTPEQVALISRMNEVQTYALTLAKKDYEVRPVEEIPEELNKMNLEFHGARSEHFTVFCRGAQRNAEEAVKWAERGLDFLVWLLGEKEARRLRVVERQRIFAWYGFLYTLREKEKFLELNPQVLRGGRAEEAARRFSNVTFRSGKGNAQVSIQLTPAARADSMIAWVWRIGLGLQRANDGLMEGAMHAACWYLKATCETRFGALPEGTVGSEDYELPESTNWWLRAMRDQARSRTDFPLVNVPRVQLARFFNDARIKTWSFMTWCIARFPDRWHRFVLEAPHDKIPFPEEVQELAKKIFERSLEEIEEEWRGWAAGRDVTAAATGYGPPLLPEAPTPMALRGLRRLNQIRAQISHWDLDQNRWVQGLPLCQHDAEASVACREHAHYLALHPEHYNWPGAHEEDPAKEGFSPRGMRAAMRSVIVISERGRLDPEGSVDGWFGVPYHRLSLLRYNVDRIGFAYDNSGQAEIMMLDMGSLPKPYRREFDRQYAIVVWPGHETRNIPVGFHAFEDPHPLEEKGVARAEQPSWGYPISATLNRTLARQLASASMEVLEMRRRPKIEQSADVLRSQGKAVPCWVHTPDEPLHSMHEYRDTIFALPKQHLETNTSYVVILKLTLGGGSQEFKWSFRTGSRRTGLGRLPDPK